MEVGEWVVAGSERPAMQIGGEAVGPLDMVVGGKVGSATGAWWTLPAADALEKLVLRVLSSSPALPLIW